MYKLLEILAKVSPELHVFIMFLMHFLTNSSYEFTISMDIQHQVHKIELYKFIPDQVGENLTNS